LVGRAKIRRLNQRVGHPDVRTAVQDRPKGDGKVLIRLRIGSRQHESTLNYWLDYVLVHRVVEVDHLDVVMASRQRTSPELTSLTSPKSDAVPRSREVTALVSVALGSKVRWRRSEGCSWMPAGKLAPSRASKSTVRHPLSRPLMSSGQRVSRKLTQRAQFDGFGDALGNFA